ncbi:hypothetical protein [Vibrio ulleungensis]|uniref:Flagellar sheath protein A n=1 Tax=Vibrio ulleungensis TaxID=2807619 RepID=A0ABS2HH10_9VIBR|nr:hypothetical protein [Vibrio ulleungensis]MBM7036828.1 hypothetical protein [Vibrio ulleungensis]
MKMRVLPIVAILSGLLAGCGGSASSGGNNGGDQGGGTTPPNKTQFTFEFYRSDDIDNSTQLSCTRYDIYDGIGGERALIYKKVIGNIDNAVFAIYSNAAGEQVGDNVHAVNGKLTVALEDIPSNGFVTIQEHGGTIINATTFTKESFSDQLGLRSTAFSLSLFAETGDCLTGGNDVTNNLKNKQFWNADDLSGNPYPRYYFNSQVDNVSSSNPQISSTGIDYINSEKVLVTQYLDEDKKYIYQYGFSDWSDSTLSYAKNLGVATIISGIQFSEIELDLLKNGYFYPLVDIDVSGAGPFEYYYPDASRGETWVYRAAGSIDTDNWEAKYVDQINTVSAAWQISINDRSLFSVENTNDAEPSTNSNVIVLTDSIAINNESGLMRVAYNQSSTPFTVTHVLYGYIGDSIVVPELDLSSIPSDIRDDLRVSDGAEFSQSYLFTNNDTDVPLDAFMTNYRNGTVLTSSAEDKLGIIKSVVEMREAKESLEQTKSLYLKRVN